jgi:hypothetical protein
MTEPREPRREAGSTPKPAEPKNAGSSTWDGEVPIWPEDYDLSDQPNQEASEPPKGPSGPSGPSGPQQARRESTPERREREQPRPTQLPADLDKTGPDRDKTAEARRRESGRDGMGDKADRPKTRDR